MLTREGFATGFDGENIYVIDVLLCKESIWGCQNTASQWVHDLFTFMKKNLFLTFTISIVSYRQDPIYVYIYICMPIP